MKDRLYYYYGLGNLGVGLIMQFIASYLVFFATVVLGMPGAFVGLIISLTVVWDAISDPIMGYISDVSNFKKFGRRHLYILIGSIGTAVFNVFLWIIPDQWSMAMKMIAFTIILFLIKTFFTIYSTPYTALGAELTNDYNGRTKVQSIKTVFFTFGLAFTTVGGMFFFFKEHPDFPTGQHNPDAYMGLAFVTSLIMVIGAVITFLKTYPLIPSLPREVVKKGEKSAGLIKRYHYAVKNKDYIAVLVAYLAANTATALIGSLGLHVFTYTFQLSSTEIGVVFAVLFLLSVTSQPLWIYLTKRYEKNGAAKLAVLVSLIGGSLFILMVIGREFVISHYWILFLYTGFSGLGTGGLLTIPLSMIADTIDEEESKSGKRMEGVYYGGLTFSYKLAQSITIFIAGIVLQVIQFNPELINQPENTVVALGLVMGIGSFLALLVTYVGYHYYRLTKDKVVEIQKKLKKDVV